jgi:hypothetical protein
MIIKYFNFYKSRRHKPFALVQDRTNPGPEQTVSVGLGDNTNPEGLPVYNFIQLASPEKGK